MNCPNPYPVVLYSCLMCGNAACNSFACLTSVLICLPSCDLASRTVHGPATQWLKTQAPSRLCPITRAGTPGLLAAIALGQLSNLMGCLTTYGIGSAPPYFGAGYVSQAKWYQLGLLLSVFYLAVWLGVGGAWWKVIGLW